MNNFNVKLTQAMIEKAREVKTAEELLLLVKENEIEMTSDEAATYFAQLNPKSGELDDDELDNVAGGACGNKAEVKDITGSEDQFHGCFKCGKCGSTTWTTDTSKYSSTIGSAGYNIYFTPRYCAQCNKRAWCMSCAYFEERDGKSWCNNPDHI